jgi:hypothetical protein
MPGLSPSGTYEPPVSGHYLDTIKLDGLDLLFNTAAFDAARVEHVRVRLDSILKDWMGSKAQCTETPSRLLNTSILSIKGLGEKTYRDIYNVLSEILPKTEGYILKHTDLAIRDDSCVVSVDFSGPVATQ